MKAFTTVAVLAACVGGFMAAVSCYVKRLQQTMSANAEEKSEVDHQTQLRLFQKESKKVWKSASARVKALVAFMQIVSSTGFNCDVTFPPLFEKLLGALGIFNLDVVPALGLQCWFASFDYVNKLVTVTLVPVAISGVLGLQMILAYMSSDATARAKKVKLASYLFLMLTFLVLVSTSTTLFHFLKCQEFDEVDPPQSYLSKDLSIDCNGDRYKAFLVYAFGMIIIYPIGIPFFYLILLRKQRAILSDPVKVEQEEADGSPNTGHLMFLTDPYKPEAYYFESVECVRRLLLASVIGVVSANSAAAPVLGILISGVFVRVFEHSRPCKRDENSSLVIILAYSLVLVFLAALLIKLDVTTDDPGDQAVFGTLLVIVFLSGPIFIILQLLLYERSQRPSPSVITSTQETILLTAAIDSARAPSLDRKISKAPPVVKATEGAAFKFAHTQEAAEVSGRLCLERAASRTGDLDTNGDGFLSMAELESGCRLLGLDVMTARQWFAELDPGRSGLVALADFASRFKQKAVWSEKSWMAGSDARGLTQAEASRKDTEVDSRKNSHAALAAASEEWTARRGPTVSENGRLLSAPFVKTPQEFSFLSDERVAERLLKHPSPEPSEVESGSQEKDRREALGSHLEVESKAHHFRMKVRARIAAEKRESVALSSLLSSSSSSSSSSSPSSSAPQSPTYSRVRGSASVKWANRARSGDAAATNPQTGGHARRGSSLDRASTSGPSTAALAALAKPRPSYSAPRSPLAAAPESSAPGTSAPAPGPRASSHPAANAPPVSLAPPPFSPI
jgi:hypothetical protein